MSLLQVGTGVHPSACLHFDVACNSQDCNAQISWKMLSASCLTWQGVWKTAGVIHPAVHADASGTGPRPWLLCDLLPAKPVLDSFYAKSPMLWSGPLEMSRLSGQLLPHLSIEQLCFNTYRQPCVRLILVTSKSSNTHWRSCQLHHFYL